MTPPLPPRVFLSFVSEHKPLVDQLRRQLAARAGGSGLRTCALDEPVSEWKRHAERLIRRSAATVCLVGDSTWQSGPVDWELRRSAQLGRPVVAFSLGPGHVRPPPALLDLGVNPAPFHPDTVALRLHDDGH